jgi:hypothetical protein
MDANRRHWNDQHLVLRRYLEKDQDYPQALEVFFSHHAVVHTAKLQPGGGWSFQDEVLETLTAEQMRWMPKGSEVTVAWMLWHMTRIEDITMNVLLASSPQVFASSNWQEKLAALCVDVGNEMTRAEILALSEAINLKALLAYRLAVGKRTRQVVRRLNPNVLWERPDPERLKSIAVAGGVREKAGWLLKYWGGHPATNLLLMPATRHPFVHFNEASRMLPKLKRLQAG